MKEYIPWTASIGNRKEQAILLGAQAPELNNVDQPTYCSINSTPTYHLVCGASITSEHDDLCRRNAAFSLLQVECLPAIAV
jgi:hypothetical protein